MAHDEERPTSPTLLRKVRDPRADEAWNDFVGWCSPTILRACRHAGLDAESTGEVHQLVLYKLFRRMQAFAYDPSRSFRGWLTRLTQRTAFDYLTARGRRMAIESFAAAWNNTYEPEELEPQTHPLLAEVEQVQAAVKARVEAKSWNAFWLADIEGVSIKEISERLYADEKHSYHAAFMAIKRVRDLLKKEGDKAIERRQDQERPGTEQAADL